MLKLLPAQNNYFLGLVHPSTIEPFTITFIITFQTILIVWQGDESFKIHH